jgi:hypothetical protein
MENSNYNGWTNYATWRVNLEMIDGMEDYMAESFDRSEKDVYEKSLHIKDYVESHMAIECGNQLTIDYALAFLAEVDWYQIADRLLERAREVA